jgi:hypothetical protein
MFTVERAPAAADLLIEADHLARLLVTHWRVGRERRRCCQRR